MHYLEIPPSPPLDEYIQCFWILEDNDSIAGPLDRVFPDGRMELIFHYGDRFQLISSGNSYLQPHAFLFGQLTKSIQIAPTGKTGIIAVRFKPNGVRAFLRLPVDQITDIIIDTHDLFGIQGDELEEKIISAKDKVGRINLLQDFLLKRLLQSNYNDEIVAKSLKEISRTSGSMRIEELSQRFDISKRQLERRFKSAVGLTPKYFGRITRFQNIFKILESRTVDNLTFLSHESGYYDQAHFIKDFKHFTGLSPKNYFFGTHPIANLFV